MQAVCKVFPQHCAENNIHLPQRGFMVSYETNIPRQCGLSGSSAIVLAAINSLIKFYQVNDRSVPLLTTASSQGLTSVLHDFSRNLLVSAVRRWQKLVKSERCLHKVS